MALLPTGFDRLLEIRTAYVDMVIKSKGRQITHVWEPGAGSSSLKVVGADIERISIPAQHIDEEYDNQNGLAIHEIQILPLFFEQTDYIITIRGKAGVALEFQSNSSSIEARVDRLIDEDPTILSGVINYRNYVGFSDLVVRANGRQVLSVRLEVYPTKISYKEDYQEIMTDINNMVSESILDYMKKTYQVFVPNHKRNEVPAVFFTILQTIYDKYLQAANRILSVPHHKLITEHELMPHYKAIQTDRHSERWLQKHPEYVRRSSNGIQAEKILSVRKQITYDTQENRLVKYILKRTLRKIDEFTRRYLENKLNPDEQILLGTKRMSMELQRLLSTTFLAEVSELNSSKSMSLVFGMAPGYRELYKYYLMLQNGITLGGDVFHMSVKDTAQLYEYWCFIKLYDILRSHYILRSPDIIKVDRKGVTIDLAKGKTSRVTFLNTNTGERIYLSYNQTESTTPTVNQRPDNILELEKRGAEHTYKYVFDAKYRIESNPEGDFYPDNKPGPKVDDINTMHRYRDSIVYENPESRFTFEKTMFGAYILFPYNNEKEYKEHTFYKSIDSVNIGGLPFLPSAISLVTDLIDELVTDSPESAFERASLPVGIEKRLRAVDWKKREVLIGFVPDKKHLYHYLKSKTYYTNRFNISHLPIHYVALYEKGEGIRWFGEVIGWQKKKKHVFNVLEWQSLETPIAVSEYGPNPVSYTNHFLLSNSSNYSELMLKSEAEYRFFSELRRRTNQAIIEDTQQATKFKYGEAEVLISKTDITVYAGETSEQYTLMEFSRHPNATFRKIQRYIELFTGKLDEKH